VIRATAQTQNWLMLFNNLEVYVMWYFVSEVCIPLMSDLECRELYLYTPSISLRHVI